MPSASSLTREFTVSKEDYDKSTKALKFDTCSCIIADCLERELACEVLIMGTTAAEMRNGLNFCWSDSKLINIINIYDSAFGAGNYDQRQAYFEANLLPLLPHTFTATLF